MTSVKRQEENIPGRALHHCEDEEVRESSTYSESRGCVSGRSREQRVGRDDVS